MHFEKIAQGLLDAAVESSLWTTAMDDLAQYAGANGTLLLKTKGRSPGTPHSESMAEGLEVYFRDGWHLKDTRERGLPLVRRKGRFADQDIASEQELRKSEYYRGFLAKYDANWSVGVGFSTPDDEWCMVALRGDRQGFFDEKEQLSLARFAPILNQAALLSRSVAYSNISGRLDVYESLQHPAFVLGSNGGVIRSNAMAEQLLARKDSGLTMRRTQLVCSDLVDQSRLQNFTEMLCRSDLSNQTSTTITIRRTSKHPLILQGLPLTGLAKSCFSTGTALLLVTDLESARGGTVDAPYLHSIFDLTKIECRLVELLLAGSSLKDASELMAVSYETTRFHLKSIFSKTRINRQSDLLRLMSAVPALRK